MQLSYRGRHYTPAVSDVSITTETFEGQFLGISGTLTRSYRDSVPNVAVPLTYRGRNYLGER